MKPFDLELAKKGHPVCTRDGKDVRIICFDAKTGEYPIIALVYCAKSCTETVHSYNLEGKHFTTEEDNSDLMMKSVRHIGWVNIHSIHTDSTHTKTILESRIYPTEDDALKAIDFPNTVIDTVKIEWEE